MNQLQLYINNELVDLADDSPIALTFQINNLAEVKNQQGNTSNQFKLPLTQRNRQILGYPDDIAFTSCKPYNNYDARVVQDGLEIIPYGTAVLNSVEQSSANITILSGNVDFFDAISGKIYEMGDEQTPYGKPKPFEKYQHTWNVQNVVRSQQHSTANGWIWPIIDYGNLVYNPTVKEHEINVRNLRPGFFIKTVIDEIIASTGYRATGSLLQNPLYPKLIAQFSNSGFEHGTDRQNKPDPTGVSVSIGADFSVTHILATGNIGTVPFTTTHFDDGHQFTATNLFTSKSINSVDVKLTIPYLRFEGRPNNEKSSYMMLYVMRENAASEVLAQHTFDLTSYTRVPGTSGSGLKGYIEARNTVITAQADIAVNDRIFVRYEFFKDRPSNFTIAKGTMLEITPTSKQVLYGQDVQCERILPDISQKDLLKDIFQRFGIICQTNNTARVINFASFKDIKDNIPIAKNWTDKCLDQGKGISFQLGSYAQVNYLKYKEDDGVLPKGFADSQIKVDDKTLPATADLFESQFAPSLDRPYIGGSITQIKMTEPDADNSDFNTSVSPRILIDRKIDLRNYNNQKITFIDGNPANNKVVNDIISVPYFYRADESDSLRWEDLRLKYYPELEKILQQTKKVERYFLLTPRDILELDLLIPVYLEQDSAYYYINKIDSWRKGQPVKVELIKLG